MSTFLFFGVFMVNPVSNFAMNKLEIMNMGLKTMELPTPNSVTALNQQTIRNDPIRSKLQPTDGKNSEQTEALSKTYLTFSEVVNTYAGIMSNHKRILREQADHDYGALLQMDDYVFISERAKVVSLAIDDFIFIDKEVKKTLDLTNVSILDDKSIDKKIQNDDLREYREIIQNFFNDIKANILTKAKETKDKIIAERNSFALRAEERRLSDKYPNIPRRTDLKQWVYDFELFYIRPDSEKIDLTTSVKELKYTMDYDTQVMPVYTMNLSISHLVVRDFKENFDNLRFFMTVRRWSKSNRNAESFIIKETIIDNQQLTPLDPDLPANGVISESPLSGMPSINIILDLVSKRNVELNTKTKSKVYNNVTMLDVITALLNEAYNDQNKDSTADKDLVKFIIAPPDNLEQYEQVILDPGSISNNLQQLQEKYGVYRTGIRIMFDTVTTEKNDKGDIVNKSVISVQDKGGTAPASKDSVKRVLIEVIDQSAQTNSPEYESGSGLYENSELLVVRTHEAYHVTKKNSRKILEGDSVRIMNSSQNDWTVSECDIKEEHDSPQKTLWSGNNNKFALTQYQDSTREKYLMIAVQLSDVDIYAFNESLKYSLKFYNNDDKILSGDYRLKTVVFSFSIGSQISSKKGIGVSSFLLFTNIPPLLINGSIIARETYEEKLQKFQSETSSFKGIVGGNGGGEGGGNGKAPSISKSLKKSGPFVPVFIGKNDYTGKVVPNEILPSYKMSRHINFDDCYTTKDGTYPERGQALCQNFDLFNYAQRFSSQILDPIIDRFGRFVGGNGRMNSFYRYHIPDGGSSTSAHLWALAADMMLSSSGNSLCEAFYWIVHSNLPFDQVILEGNGSEWRWIHVGMNNKGNNRKQVFVSFTGKSAGMLRVNVSRFTSPDKANWNKARTELR